MRKIRFLSLFVAAGMSIAVIAGCAGDTTETPSEPVQLTAPQITLSDNVISWQSVEHADGYTVYEGEESVATTASLSYTIDETEPGSYTFSVVATSTDDAYSQSARSNTVTYTVEQSVTALAAPQITLTDNVISWQSVEHADSYTVYEGEEVVSTTASLSYTIDETEPGTYTFTVAATSTDDAYSQSALSNSVVYTVSEPVQLEQTTIYVVGDSTVCSFNDAYYLPRYGYGTQLENYLDDSATVVNLALSGRSSYSFLSEANYTTLTSSIGEGDYLIIGFGHNDQKNEFERYTNPNLPYTDSTTLFNNRPASFQYTLYNYYIKMALDKGATPILCTPIVRLSSSNDYTGANGHITSDSATTDGTPCPGGDYAQAIRTLGAAVDVTVIDLTQMTKDDYTQLGYDSASNYHAWTATKDGVRVGLDGTHTNMYGAKMNAYHFATALAQTENPLGDYVLAGITKPTYETDYAAAINPNYVEPSYMPFDPATDKSANWTTITKEGWYGTVMGDIGGNSVTPFTVSQTGDNFTVGTSQSKGKISSSADGFAAVFTQIAANKNFEVSATVTLDTYSSTNQTAFGLMLRDDIYIDEYSTAVNANYVSAGAYCTSSATNIIYCRENTKLAASGNSAVLAQGSTHTLSITKTNQTVIVTFDNYSQTYTDFDFVAIDNDYVYICLYATRTTVATFSNVQLTIMGDSVSA